MIWRAEEWMVVSPSEITLTLGHPGLSLLASASPRFVWLSNWAGPVKDLNIFIIFFSRAFLDGNLSAAIAAMIFTSKRTPIPHMNSGWPGIRPELTEGMFQSLTS